VEGEGVKHTLSLYSPRGVFVALVLALALSSARPVHGSGSLHSHQSAADSTTIRLADLLGHATDLNPIIGRRSVLNYLLFAHLTTVNSRGQVVPDLLAQLPSRANHELSADGTTVILQLKPHQSWSSGIEITSADILFGWQVASADRFLPLCESLCDHIASVRVSGRYTAILRLKQPYAPLLSYCLPPVLPHSWKRLGATPHDAALHLTSYAFTYQDPSYWTDGPYQIERFDGATGVVSLRRMPHYHVHPGPYAARLIYSTRYRSAQDLADAVAWGTVDLAGSYGPLDLPPLMTAASIGGAVLTPSFDVMALQFNVLDPTYGGKANPMRDERVRQALALAIDRTAATRELGLSQSNARALVASSPFLVSRQVQEQVVPQASAGTWDPVVKRYVPSGPQAVRDARLLLERAGYGKGLSVDLLAQTMGNNKPVPGTAAIQADWLRIGVQTQVQLYLGQMACTEYVLSAGRFEVYLGDVVNGPDPNDLRTSLDSRFIIRLFPPPSIPCDLENISGIQNGAIDAGFRRGVAAADPTQRAYWYGQVQDAVRKHAYWAPLYYLPNVLIHDRRVRGVSGSPLPSPDQFGAYGWNAFQWRSAP